jgi:hypothetical protein
MKPTLPLTDIYFTAFASLHGLAAKLARQDNRIVFLFPNDEKIKDLSKRYYGNEAVPIIQYVDELKKIKSAMYLAKEGGLLEKN